MDLEHIRLLYAYNRWANTRILDQAEKLTPEQLHAPNNGSFGSVRDTLVHLMETEYFWSGLIWPGKAIDIDWEPFEFDPNDYQDVAAIRARWAEIESGLSAFIDELTPEGENSPERMIVWSDDGKMLRRPLWPDLLGVAIHATQHRSEIAMMLTQYGYSPGNLDLSYDMRKYGPDSAASHCDTALPAAHRHPPSVSPPVCHRFGVTVWCLRRKMGIRRHSAVSQNS